MANAVENAIFELENLGVLVMESSKLANLCLSLEDGKITCFNSKLFGTSSEQCTALLHEAGHFASGAFYQPYSPLVLKEQAEYRADKAAIINYIPKDEIDCCIALGKTELWEFAEYFGVTEAFMFKAVLYYKEQDHVR